MSEQNYLNLLTDIMTRGEDKGDRTGTGTRSLFGTQMRFDLRWGFPLLTTKRVWMKGVTHELLWLLSGARDINYLTANDVHIWDEWAEPSGFIGNSYGFQWRHWQHPDFGSVDQIFEVVDSIRTNPFGRRHIVTAWNPSDVEDVTLPPCHILFQFNVGPDEDGAPKWLDCQLYQRSADMFLGVPFNIASYALLTSMVAQVTGLLPRHFVWTGGDTHIYNNHFDQVRQQLSRTPGAAPTLLLNPNVEDIDAFTYDDIVVANYHHQGAIAAPVAV